MPQGRDFERYAVLSGQTLAHLRQSDIRPGSDPGTQHILQRRHERLAVPANGQTGTLAFPLEPVADVIDPEPAHFKPLRNRARAIASLHRAENPLP